MRDTLIYPFISALDVSHACVAKKAEKVIRGLYFQARKRILRLKREMKCLAITSQKNTKFLSWQQHLHGLVRVVSMSIRKKYDALGLSQYSIIGKSCNSPQERKKIAFVFIS